MINVLHISSRFISFEIDSTSPYEAVSAYAIYLNNHMLREDKRHVQTLFGLMPGTTYTLRVEGDIVSEIEFTTTEEDFTFDVKDFGAVGDGIHDDTQAIQAALYTCPKNGRVLIPEGTYSFSSLFLKSNTKVELLRGAVLRAQEKHEERAIFPGLVRNKDNDKFYLGSWEGNPLDSFASLLNLVDVENIEIYGEGIIDGNASNNLFWKDIKVRRLAWRPRTIFMKDAKHISVVGITIKNSPSWTIHPMFSRHLKFINTYIQNPWDSPNTDGIDPESSQNIEIIGCSFSLGDDCIAIKAGKIYMANALQTPSKNITVRNCHMQHGHGGVTIGSEMAAGVQNVLVEKCIFEDTDRGLRIKTRRGRGKLAVVDRVHFKNIKMKAVMTAFVLNMFYYCDPDGHSEFVQCKEDRGQNPEDLPSLKHFVFENIEVEDTSVCGFFAYGLPENKIQSILLKNISIGMKPLAERNDGEPAMMDCNEWEKTDVVFLKNIHDVKTENVRVELGQKDRIFSENVDHENIKAIAIEYR